MIGAFRESVRLQSVPQPLKQRAPFGILPKGVGRILASLLVLLFIRGVV